jgi:hypothetical protein
MVNWRNVGFIIGTALAAGALVEAGVDSGRDLVFLALAAIIALLLISLTNQKDLMSISERPHPVAVCTSCFMATHSVSFINRVHICAKGQQGIWRLHPADTEWDRCRLCQTTGMLSGRKCDSCDGTGWIFVGLRCS